MSESVQDHTTRIVLTGGGTGGHLYPAVAVLEALKTRLSSQQLLYIGNLHKPEAQMIPDLGIEFRGLIFSGMPRKPGLAWLGWFMQLFSCFWTARRWLAEFKPNRVFATGGYVTAPVLLAAKSLGIPFVIHEPDAHPGLVNRLMARWSQTTTLAFEGARALLGNARTDVTGNPIRADIGQMAPDQASRLLGLELPPTPFVVLITGGSQGAKSINQAVAGCITTLLEDSQTVVIHQTGRTHYEAYLKGLPEALLNHPRYRVRPYFDQMPAVLSLTTLAVCRSGSMTLSELFVAGIPMILIPYPWAAANHQEKNARFVASKGAAEVILDQELTPQRLSQVVSALRENSALLAERRQCALALASPMATHLIVSYLLDSELLQTASRGFQLHENVAQ